MKFMFPKHSVAIALAAFFVFSLVSTGSISAQSKRGAHPKKADAKKTERQTKDARKDKEARKGREVKKGHEAKNDRDTAKADARSKKDPKKLVEQKKAAAERRRREEERRQAILAERRRREQAIREAHARQLAFEHGLRTETVANISKDVTEGEDLSLRQAAVNALGGHAGSVVVMEAQTGKVLTIVNQDWAVRSGIKPCSTIKLVTGVAALNENVINKADGSIANTRTRRDLDDAVAFSDNGFFQRAGMNVGNAKMIEYAKQLGLGEPTGLNTTGEYAGKLPYGNGHARIYSHGDDFEVTGLQLAVMVSAITNGGHRVLPRIPRSSVENARFQTFYKAELTMPQQNVRRMIPGMIGAAEYGTAHRGVDASLGIAGKTGSCISKGSWVGLFASVAPIENPKYSVVVITRGQHERGKYAAAVAGQIYRALSPQLVRTDRNLAQTEFMLKPKSSIDPRTAAKVADEEDEDETADASDDAEINITDDKNTRRDVIVVPSAPKQGSKKLVVKTVDSKPLFPPVVITYDRDPTEKKRGSRTKPQ